MATQHLGRLVHLYSRVTRPVFLTGAGLSAAAGLPTYRGPGGVLEDPNAPSLPLGSEDLTTRPDEVAAYITSIATASDDTRPSGAHHALSAYQRVCGARGGIATVTTMNIDDLHERSGTHTHHLHGRAHYSRCEECEAVEMAPPGACARCGRQTRPDVVLYGEPLDRLGSWETKRALRDADVVTVIGVSGSSSQVQRWVRYATLDQRIPTVLITKAPESQFAGLFTHVVDADVSILSELFATELASA